MKIRIINASGHQRGEDIINSDWLFGHATMIVCNFIFQFKKGGR